MKRLILLPLFLLAITINAQYYENYPIQLSNVNAIPDSSISARYSIFADSIGVDAWDDLIVSGTIANSGVNAPSLRSFRGSSLVKRYALAGGGQNDDFNFEWQLPHSAIYNDTAYPHLHCSPETAPVSTDTAVFLFSHTSADVHDTFSIVQDTLVIVPLGDYEAWEHVIVDFGWIITGELSSIIACNIQRVQNNSHDTYAGYIHVLSIDMHIRKNRFGSKNPLSD